VFHLLRYDVEDLARIGVANLNPLEKAAKPQKFTASGG
jgi:hypothetical protein